MSVDSSDSEIRPKLDQQRYSTINYCHHRHHRHHHCTIESSLAMEAVSDDSSNSEVRPKLDQQRKHLPTVTTVIATPENNETLDIF
eukprot:1540085-Ditylum_brightwellii.AAC.1